MKEREGKRKRGKESEIEGKRERARKKEGEREREIEDGHRFLQNRHGGLSAFDSRQREGRQQKIIRGRDPVR